MSLHGPDWLAIIEELKKDLPWLLDLLHLVKTSDANTHLVEYPGTSSDMLGSVVSNVGNEAVKPSK